MSSTKKEVGDGVRSDDGAPGQRSNLSAEPERISAHVPDAPAHTPGPWKITKGQYRNNATDEYEPYHFIEGSIPVCDINSFGDEEEENANARLIASAPTLLEQNTELLEALKGVVRVADRKTVEFEAARAIIAKCEAQVA